MKKASVLDYTFAIGKIRSLERFLLKNEIFQEAIESDLFGALRLFAESDLYSDKILHVKDSQQLETILNQELFKVKGLVSALILDKELIRLLEINDLREMLGIIRTYQSKFLEDYLMYLIDMHNIKTFLRLYLLKEPQELLRKNLTCEGFIKREVFLNFYLKELPAFLHQLEYVHKDSAIIDYAFYLAKGIRNLEKERSFIALEKAINDFMITVLKPAKFISFGPEPILAYYFAKVNEINLIRLIILAKLNDVSIDLVKERLNAVYG